MRRVVVRLPWYRCWHNWMDVTHPITLMGFLLSRIPLPLPVPLSLSIPLPVPLALTHPLIIDISLAVMLQFHRRSPTLCWRHSSYRQARARLTYWRKRGRRGREWMMWAGSSTVAMMHLAFQTIAFTLVLEKRARWKGHGSAGLSFPFSFPVSVSFSISVPIPIPLALTVSVHRARGKGRPRQGSRSCRRRAGPRYGHHAAMWYVIPTITITFPVRWWRGRLQAGHHRGCGDIWP
jgi:hypothetical protein